MAEGLLEESSEEDYESSKDAYDSNELEENSFESDEESVEYLSSSGESSDGEEFEDQGSSSSEDGSYEEESMNQFESNTRSWNMKNSVGSDTWMHTDNLSSDDEEVGNRIGRVPLHWYDDMDHIGYDDTGSKIIKSTEGGDLIDMALKNADGNNSMTVTDALNGKEVVLSARQVELIRRVQMHAFAHPEFDANPDYIDYFSGVDPEPWGLNSDRVPPKSRFQPSKWEQLMVRRLLFKLQTGKIQLEDLKAKPAEKETQKKDFILWKDDDEDVLASRKGLQHIPPPKNPPPTHGESYNPPEEYLPSREELEEWENMDMADRPYGRFVPKKFNSLRAVGSYEHSVLDTFERCLDIYLCPRVIKKRLNIDPESLVPSLPKPSELRPFPTTLALEYKTPEKSIIRCMGVSPDGLYMVSGGEDGFINMFEVQSTKLIHTWNAVALINSTEIKPIVSLQWNPNSSHHCILAGVGSFVILLKTPTPKDECTDALFSSIKETNDSSLTTVKWTSISEGCLLEHDSDIIHVSWHHKGDYFSSNTQSSLLIHQLSKAKSQQPFTKKTSTSAQKAYFHPNKPFLFVVFKTEIRVYHLVKQTMIKRLLSGCKFISNVDIHSSGDHVVASSLDRKVVWLDLDLSQTPYKTLKYHTKAVRQVRFHPRYPIMASCSDDTTIHVFHTRVYNDLMRNPLIVPVKIIKTKHELVNHLGVLAIAFHPTQPWVFSAGADGKILLFQDMYGS